MGLPCYKNDPHPSVDLGWVRGIRGDELNKGINLDELLRMVQVSDALLC